MAGDKVAGEKSGGAFLTIGEVAERLGLGQHILRYWETKFPQLKPLQRAGNRRYYRPADVTLAARIDRLLNHEGYTMRGVQKLLAQEEGAPPPPADMRAELRDIRAELARALAEEA